MFGQCPIFVYLGLRSILILCELAKMGEYGVLPEYLRKLMVYFASSCARKSFLSTLPTLDFGNSCLNSTSTGSLYLASFVSQ